MIATAWNAIRSEPGVFIFLGFALWAYVKFMLFTIRSANMK